MRIRVCSSDVCASDLKADAEQRLAAAEQAAAFGALPVKALGEAYAAAQIPDAVRTAMASGKNRETTPRAAAYLYQSAQSTEERSEEHTSELQSLMRTSYDVFCLKKKIKINKHT